MNYVVDKMTLILLVLLGYGWNFHRKPNEARMLNIAVDMMSLILLLKFVCKEAGAKNANIKRNSYIKSILSPKRKTRNKS